MPDRDHRSCRAGTKHDAAQGLFLSVCDSVTTPCAPEEDTHLVHKIIFELLSISLRAEVVSAEVHDGEGPQEDPGGLR